MKSRHVRWRAMVRGLCLWIALAGLVSCRSDYTTQHFSFPPGSKPHEPGWEYAGVVMVSSRATPITKHSRKTIQIEVYDKRKRTLLRDTIVLNAATIRSTIHWESAGELGVQFTEVGNPHATDRYNAELLKQGPQELLRVDYMFEPEGQRYVRR
jgi:hypothetical protein